jgi:DNA-directed RNA polymerase subunit H
MVLNLGKKESDFEMVDNDLEIKIKEDVDDEEPTEFDSIEESEDQPKKRGRKKRKTGKRVRKIKEEITHCYVPKHELLTSEEIDKLIEVGVTSESLPKIFVSDPGICHLEIKPGDVIRITRKNPQIGDTVYYRVVVSAD